MEKNYAIIFGIREMAAPAIRKYASGENEAVECNTASD